MNLSSRIARMEASQNVSGNPLADLTDEQLDAAIAQLKAEIRAETGMDETELANELSQQLIEGRLSDDLDPKSSTNS